MKWLGVFMDWVHDPKSSFNTGTKPKPMRHLLDPEYPDGLIKGKKYEVKE